MVDAWGSFAFLDAVIGARTRRLDRVLLNACDRTPPFARKCLSGMHRWFPLPFPEPSLDLLLYFYEMVVKDGLGLAWRTARPSSMTSRARRTFALPVSR